MPQLNLKIVSRDQKFTFESAYGKEIFTDGISLTDAAIIEGGMQSGKTSVMLGIEYGDQYIIAETSAGLIEHLYHAIKGAEARWKEIR